MVSHPRHLPNTLNSDFLGSLVWRWDQKLNSNICSDRWTPAAQNQCTVQRDVAGEASLGVLRPVIPVEETGNRRLYLTRSSSLKKQVLGA